ncbi:MAG TPA: hypothetical protein VHD38_01935, partial [Candidatus Paceibacterota bacterium]|nr:hypothetical protein [Candidatus Paceibacterota bacterium]
MSKRLLSVGSFFGVLALPFLAFAHEVYVLDAATVRRAMAMQSPNPFDAIAGNEKTFLFWGFVTFVVFSTALAASVFRPFEKRLDPTLHRLKKYALPVARVTVGLCFLAFAYSGNLYGSELFLAQGFGAAAPYIQLLLGVLGVAATIGFATRAAGAGMLLIYAAAWGAYGSYMLTYTDFLGAAALITILGGGLYSIDAHIGWEPFKVLARVTTALRPFAFPVARICFGWGVLFASIYAKYLHSELAYQVVVQYDLTRFFPFDPLFVVLGALIIEFLAGSMVLFGVAIRWTLLFLAFWLTLSLMYFQELIWPHGILFGLAIALFLHGYDRYSLQGRFF